MSIVEQFNSVAKEYDANHRIFISCFDEYYAATTDFIAAKICKSRKGFGFGREECRLPLERKTGRRESSLRNQRRPVLRLQKPWKNLPWTFRLVGQAGARRI